MNVDELLAHPPGLKQFFSRGRRKPSVLAPQIGQKKVAIPLN
jgi:hypothetical protein